VQTYEVAAGLQVFGRALWNFDYDVNTAQGVLPGDAVKLAAAPGLGAYDFKLEITQAGPQFLSPATAIFDLDATTHVWTDGNNHNINTNHFGGDDFAHTPSADVMKNIAGNSENFGFAPFEAEFGPVAESTTAGASYDFRLVGFDHNTGHMVSSTESVIHLV
jgi:hypothetical protein